MGALGGGMDGVDMMDKVDAGASKPRGWRRLPLDSLIGSWGLRVMGWTEWT